MSTKVTREGECRSNADEDIVEIWPHDPSGAMLFVADADAIRAALRSNPRLPARRHLLPLVRAGIVFVDGVQQANKGRRQSARAARTRCPNLRRTPERIGQGFGHADRIHPASVVESRA